MTTEIGEIETGLSLLFPGYKILLGHSMVHKLSWIDVIGDKHYVGVEINPNDCEDWKSHDGFIQTAIRASMVAIGEAK